MADAGRPSRRGVALGLGALMAVGGWPVTAVAQRAARKPALPSYPDKLSDPAIDAVFERAEEALKAQTAAHNGTWHMDGARWSVDLDAGTITFINKRGWTISAPVQVIGTRSLADGTWLWGWDHPSVSVAQAANARLVRAFGRRQGLARLTTRKIEASERDAWRFTALAAYLAGANGAYRGPTGPTEVFMTFGEIVIAKD